MDIRSFAEICLSAAKGNDVQSRLQQHLASGVSKKALFDLALQHQVVALLAASFIETGIAEECNSPKPGLFAARQMLMRAQLTQLDAALVARSAQVTLLKGSIQLFRPVYARPGMRQMADIDVLLDDVAALAAFADLGYQPASDQEAMPTTLELGPGKHHLSPLSRPRDIAPIEPHVLATSRNYAHLIGDIIHRAQPAPGLATILLPDPVDQLLITLVHALFHDRSSMHGGLFLKSLVDCELLYDGLTQDQKREGEALLSERGGGSIWRTWRTFADWCFHRADAAPRHGWRAFLLIREFETRSRGKAGAMSAALANLGIDLLKPHFWRSGQADYFTKKIVDGTFWKRFFIKIRTTPKN